MLKRGEIAIRARQRAQRVASKRWPARDRLARETTTPDQSDQAVAIAEAEADSASKAPPRLAKVAGEAVDLDDLGFITSTLVDSLESPTSISVEASEQRIYLAAEAGVLQAAVDASETAQAGNSLEKMLAHQLAAAHRAAMRLVARVGSTQLPILEMARLSNASARMMQVFQEGLLTLQKLRSDGKQSLIVQHVQVSEGGQAVIAQGIESGRKGSGPR